jgi:hypothetical protein
MKIALTGDDSGYETEEKARIAAEAHARKLVLDAGLPNGANPCVAAVGCAGTSKCIRVASQKAIDAAITSYSYDDTDDDQSWGWYLEATVDTLCVCAKKAK